MENSVIDTYKNDANQIAVLCFDPSGHYCLEYYTSEGIQYHIEVFEGKSIHYVKDAAYNWSIGIKKDPSV